jgi:hypothetical protein
VHPARALRGVVAIQPGARHRPASVRSPRPLTKSPGSQRSIGSSSSGLQPLTPGVEFNSVFNDGTSGVTGTVSVLPCNKSGVPPPMVRKTDTAQSLRHGRSLRKVKL